MADEPWRKPLDETWAMLDREAAGSPAWSGELKVIGEAGQLPSRLPVEDVAVAAHPVRQRSARMALTGGAPVSRPGPE
jgi:hypothetical protein